MPGLTIGLVQVDPTEDEAANPDTAFRLIGEAADAGAELVAPPQIFHCRGPAARGLGAGPLRLRPGTSCRR